MTDIYSVPKLIDTVSKVTLDVIKINKDTEKDGLCPSPDTENGFAVLYTRSQTDTEKDGCNLSNTSSITTIAEEFNEKKINKNIICCNCGKTGHVYKKCFNPITSFGIICFKTNNFKSVSSLTSLEDWKNKIIYDDVKKFNLLDFKFLLIKRKDSIAFAEFVRVKYNITDTDYIKTILGNMTQNELLFLQNTTNPDDIWNKLWTSKKKSRTRMNEYSRVKKKLILLINGTKNKDGTIFNLKSLIANIISTRTESEWGFPKGRRVPKESDITCAIREFCEETDIDKKNINVLKNIGPVEEIFTGSNNIVYRHVYYIAELKNDIPVIINPNNIHQLAEIGDIQWFTQEEAIKKIEHKNKERVNVFTKVSNYLKYLPIPSE
jgi:8-oxo-dGTP pyrophosphatase MutT (NUDIX family)